MRPNIRYRNEMDNEALYKSQTVMNIVSEADCLVVIGQPMIGLHSKKIIAKMLDLEKPVIEVNPVPLINKGNNIQVKGSMDENIKALFKAYKSSK